LPELWRIEAAKDESSEVRHGMIPSS